MIDSTYARQACAVTRVHGWSELLP